jgi:hypothetical protein
MKENKNRRGVGNAKCKVGVGKEVVLFLRRWPFKCRAFLFEVI